MPHIGIDIIEIDRIEKAIARWGESFLHRVYTAPELELYHKKPSSLAARFASKEAIMKTLRTQARGISWQEIEILADSNGKPFVHLYGKAQSQAISMGLDNLAITLSHSREYAIACIASEAK